MVIEEFDETIIKINLVGGRKALRRGGRGEPRVSMALSFHALVPVAFAVYWGIGLVGGYAGLLTPSHFFFTH